MHVKTENKVTQNSHEVDKNWIYFTFIATFNARGHNAGEMTSDVPSCSRMKIYHQQIAMDKICRRCVHYEKT